jgi:hypothetical protein
MAPTRRTTATSNERAFRQTAAIGEPVKGFLLKIVEP